MYSVKLTIKTITLPKIEYLLQSRGWPTIQSNLGHIFIENADNSSIIGPFARCLKPVKVLNLSNLYMPHFFNLTLAMQIHTCTITEFCLGLAHLAERRQFADSAERRCKLVEDNRIVCFCKSGNVTGNRWGLSCNTLTAVTFRLRSLSIVYEEYPLLSMGLLPLCNSHIKIHVGGRIIHLIAMCTNGQNRI